MAPEQRRQLIVGSRAAITASSAPASARAASNRATAIALISGCQR
jgi:hypothetical protein